MTTTDTTNNTAALTALKSCRDGLYELKLDAVTAAGALTGARASRANELVGKIADVIAHCERLVFVVTGDLHADGDLDAAVARHPAGRERK